MSSDAFLVAVHPSALELGDAKVDDGECSNAKALEALEALEAFEAFEAERIEATDSGGSHPARASAADPHEEPTEISVPIIRRMRSGGRICRELGFDTVEAASDPPEGYEDGLDPVVISVARAASERSVCSEPDILPPSRMPSLRALVPPCAFQPAAV